MTTRKGRKHRPLETVVLQCRDCQQRFRAYPDQLLVRCPYCQHPTTVKR